MNLPDKKIIEELSNGNETVYNELFTFYYKSLCMFGRKYVYDLDQAEEIVQNIFVKIWNNRNQLTKVLSIKTYLFTSVRNGCIDYIRKEKVRKKYANEIIQTSVDYFEPEIIPDKELSLKIKEAINQLPKQRKKIFQMNKTYGLRYKEIAERLDISPKTVENQMGIALKQLRELLKDCMVLSLFIFIIEFLFL